ncbi:MAG TPA: GIY-YIG nuclease family protein [Anaerolineaceae bacterium]
MAWQSGISYIVFQEDAYQLPPVGGVYALWLRLVKPAKVEVGRIGIKEFLPGEYIYAGSARGKGGIAARLQHHFRHTNHPTWHLDYLRPHCQVIAAWYWTIQEASECLLAKNLAELPGAFIPVPGFGSRDCIHGCRAHLIAFPPQTSLFDYLQISNAWRMAIIGSPNGTNS